MRTPCNVIRDLLPLYRGGICSPESRKTVEEHLALCRLCQQVEAQEEQKAEAAQLIGRPNRKLRLAAIAVLCFLLVAGTAGGFFLVQAEKAKTKILPYDDAGANVFRRSAFSVLDNLSKVYRLEPEQIVNYFRLGFDENGRITELHLQLVGYSSSGDAKNYYTISKDTGLNQLRVRKFPITRKTGKELTRFPEYNLNRLMGLVNHLDFQQLVSLYEGKDYLMFFSGGSEQSVKGDPQHVFRVDSSFHVSLTVKDETLTGLALGFARNKEGVMADRYYVMAL